MVSVKNRIVMRVGSWFKMDDMVIVYYDVIFRLKGMRDGKV